MNRLEKRRDELAHNYAMPEYLNPNWELEPRITPEDIFRLKCISFQAGFDACLAETKCLVEALEWYSQEQIYLKHSFPIGNEREFKEVNFTNIFKAKAREALKKFYGK